MRATGGLRTFSGAVAIITGAASGIGRALAEELAIRGCDVVLADLQIQAAYGVMTAQGYGHIVNTASFAGMISCPGLVSYAATKHAVLGLSTSLRGEARSRGIYYVPDLFVRQFWKTGANMAGR